MVELGMQLLLRSRLLLGTNPLYFLQRLYPIFFFRHTSQFRFELLVQLFLYLLFLQFRMQIAHIVYNGYIGSSRFSPRVPSLYLLPLVFFPHFVIGHFHVLLIDLVDHILPLGHKLDNPMGDFSIVFPSPLLVLFSLLVSRCRLSFHLLLAWHKIPMVLDILLFLPYTFGSSLQPSIVHDNKIVRLVHQLVHTLETRLIHLVRLHSLHLRIRWPWSFLFSFSPLPLNLHSFEFFSIGFDFFFDPKLLSSFFGRDGFFLLTLLFGENGIRTHDPYSGQRFSKPAPSATQPSLPFFSLVPDASACHSSLRLQLPFMSDGIRTRVYGLGTDCLYHSATDTFFSFPFSFPFSSFLSLRESSPLFLSKGHFCPPSSFSLIHFFRPLVHQRSPCYDL